MRLEVKKDLWTFDSGEANVLNSYHGFILLLHLY